MGCVLRAQFLSLQPMPAQHLRGADRLDLPKPKRRSLQAKPLAPEPTHVAANPQ